MLLDNDSKTSESTSAHTRGKQLIRFMNSLNMVIINGIDSGGDFTFNDKSIVDYIIVSENIFAPTFRSDLINPGFNQDIKSSIIINDDIPIDSLYVKKSCKSLVT